MALVLADLMDEPTFQVICKTVGFMVLFVGFMGLAVAVGVCVLWIVQPGFRRGRPVIPDPETRELGRLRAKLRALTWIAVHIGDLEKKWPRA